ncbi:hypothetical protein KCP73_18970 [Salmonella enterica subsp. enterica]|nr:hypothetical protein KCP73_18970 [Salmonella enterica subsp. enterica]
MKKCGGQIADAEQRRIISAIRAISIRGTRTVSTAPLTLRQVPDRHRGTTKHHRNGITVVARFAHQLPACSRSIILAQRRCDTPRCVTTCDGVNVQCAVKWEAANPANTVIVPTRASPARCAAVTAVVLNQCSRRSFKHRPHLERSNGPIRRYQALRQSGGLHVAGGGGDGNHRLVRA